MEFDFESQGQSLREITRILTNVFAPIIQIWWSWLEGVMSCGSDNLGVDAHTQTYTDTQRQTQATTIPKVQNWLRVKNEKCVHILWNTVKNIILTLCYQRK